MLGRNNIAADCIGYAQMDAIDTLWPQHCSSLVSLACPTMRRKSLHGGRCVAVLVTLSAGSWARCRRHIDELLDWLQPTSSEKAAARCLHWEQHKKVQVVL
jgi:hypothetical protein